MKTLLNLILFTFMAIWINILYQDLKSSRVKYEPDNTINEVVTAKLLGNMYVTAYRSVPNQTDYNPFITADGTHVNPYGVAISRDLFKEVKYGDILYIESVGFKVVNDCMNLRHKKHIDVWVETYHDEKVFHSQYKGKKVKVYLVSLISEMAY